MLLAAHGSYVTDNLSVFFWDPWKLTRELTTAWNPDLDLGGPAAVYAPGVDLVAAALRGAGLEPWLVERLFHAILLGSAGTGAAMVTWYFLPGRNVAAFTAGVVYMTHPFAVSFLLPSWLFMNAALAPWFLLALLRGATGGGRWRWAAVFALALVGSGVINPPGVVFALLPLPVAAVYLVHVDGRARWLDVARWASLAVGLSVIVLLPAISRFVAESDVLAANLAGSESVEAVSRSSSWSESWRGLGFWLAYYGETGTPAVGQAARYVSSLPLVLLTFLPPLVALAVVWRSRWRPRILFGTCLVVGVVAMVGAYPVDDPSPWGRLLLETYERVGALFAFRNSYKAGPALALGSAVLVAYGVWWLSRRLDGHRIGRWALLGGVVAFGAVSAAPLWTGSLYVEGQRVDDVPDYYVDATDWLDEQPGTGRAIVFPLTQQDGYRWAEAPDFDLFRPYLDRGHLRRAILSHSGAYTTDLLDELAAWLADGDPAAWEALPPILRRLGVEFVVVRNDLRWERLATPRPAEVHDRLTGTELEEVASFGDEGENVVAEDDDAAPAVEQRLPPVTIYRLPGVDGRVRASRGAGPTLVSGAGGGWANLAESGALGIAGPIRYTARMSDDELTSAFDSGATLHVTDSNRRRAGGFGPGSETLAAGDDRRDVRDLFGTPGSQSTATFSDATEIIDTSPPTLFAAGRSNRAAAAFDADPTTAWYTGSMDPDPTYALRAELVRPTTVSAATITVAVPSDATRRIDAAEIRFSDGSAEIVDLTDRTAEVRFTPRETEWLEVGIDSVAGFGGSFVGFSEIEFEGVDLREFVRTPDDVFRTADTDGDLAEQLATAPIRYDLRRLGGYFADEESVLRREIFVPDGRSLDVAGHARLTRDVDDSVLADLLALPLRASATGGEASELRNRAFAAVDGDLSTAWEPPADTVATLRLDMAERVVSAIDVALALGRGAARVDELEVRVGDEDPVVVDVDTASSNCFPGDAPADAPECRVVRIEVPPTSTSSVTVTVPEGSASGEGPLRLLEVSLGSANAQPAPVVADTCIDIGLSASELDISVRFEGSVDDLLDGARLPIEGCGAVPATTGWHRIDSGPAVVVDDLTLSTATADDVASADPVDVDETRRSPTHHSASIGAAGVTSIVSGDAFDGRWRATTGGESLGRPVMLDLQAGWVIPDGAEIDQIDFRLQGATTYRWTVLVSGIGSLVAMALVIGNPGAVPASVADPAVRSHWRGERRRRRWRRLLSRPIIGATMVVLSILVAGWIGAVVSLVAVVLVLPRPDSGREIALGALICLALAAVLTVPPLGPDLVITPDFGRFRSEADALARVATVLLIVALAAFVTETRLHRTGGPPPDRDDRPSLRDGHDRDGASR